MSMTMPSQHEADPCRVAVDVAVDAALLWDWLAGRSLARGLPMPVPDHGGMRVDTAAPDEVCRYVFAGPAPAIRTLAASGIKDFRKMLAHCEAVTPIRRTVTIEDVGNSAAFLCSDLAGGITGEIVHVDGGFSIAAMNELELK